MSPSVGNCVHHIANSKDFAELIKKEIVEVDEKLRSYDVTALFTSIHIPVDKALKIIQARLEKDKTLKDSTRLPAKRSLVYLKCV